MLAADCAALVTLGWVKQQNIIARMSIIAEVIDLLSSKSQDERSDDATVRLITLLTIRFKGEAIGTFIIGQAGRVKRAGDNIVSLPSELPSLLFQLQPACLFLDLLHSDRRMISNRKLARPREHSPNGPNSLCFFYRHRHDRKAVRKGQAKRSHLERHQLAALCAAALRKHYKRAPLSEQLNRLALRRCVGGDIKVHRKCAEHPHQQSEHRYSKRFVPRHVIDSSRHGYRDPDRIGVSDVIRRYDAGAFARNVVDAMKLNLECHPAKQ